MNNLPGFGLESGAALAADAADQPGTYGSAFGFGRQSLGISAGHGLALPVGGTDNPEMEDIQFVYVTPRWVSASRIPWEDVVGTGETSS
ncbi:MAG TPA: hypothetical protein VF182_13265 [Candidatus Binatia bacterium]